MADNTEDHQAMDVADETSKVVSKNAAQRPTADRGRGQPRKKSKSGFKSGSQGGRRGGYFTRNIPNLSTAALGVLNSFAGEIQTRPAIIQVQLFEVFRLIGMTMGQITDLPAFRRNAWIWTEFQAVIDALTHVVAFALSVRLYNAYDVTRGSDPWRDRMMLQLVEWAGYTHQAVMLPTPIVQFLRCVGRVSTGRTNYLCLVSPRSEQFGCILGRDPTVLDPISVAEGERLGAFLVSVPRSPAAWFKVGGASAWSGVGRVIEAPPAVVDGQHVPRRQYATPRWLNGTIGEALITWNRFVSTLKDHRCFENYFFDERSDGTLAITVGREFLHAETGSARFGSSDPSIAVNELILGAVFGFGVADTVCSLHTSAAFQKVIDLPDPRNVLASVVNAWLMGSR